MFLNYLIIIDLKLKISNIENNEVFNDIFIYIL
jgi:hypothetical protein